jgi:SAM-dependent methyltransferase
MPEVLEHKDGRSIVTELDDGTKSVKVELHDPAMFSPRLECQTSYPIDLIKLILDIKGPAWVCDEITRDEDPDYVALHLEKEMRAYFRFEDFAGKLILDFGCGSGASTMLLARMFPNSQIVGIELEKDLIRIARRRLAHYAFENVRFVESPIGTSVPDELGSFDLIVLSAVYEHLLPDERKVVLPKLWSMLNANGVLFLNQTPHRWFPLELHTTSLPLINYLPDGLTLKASRKFSPRVNEGDSWEFLLRAGIRGATVREIKKLLPNAQMLKPTLTGLNDRVDLWFLTTNPDNMKMLKQSARLVLKSINVLTGIAIVPELTLAFRKR